ncbi:hypothetical protein DL96DRAFT_1581219 [Flagelloscypha sp. PMI_526]|nr:hypothetical protein DL96DRAFT_1581219 [Flagelloscypha sp. PMI_526]
MTLRTFPPELLLQVLTALDGPTLRSSSLVNRDFYSIAQGLNFRHLYIRGAVGRQLAQFDFLLADENHHLCSRVRKVSIDFDHLFENPTIPPQLLALLVKLGPQIKALCINGELWNEIGPYSMRWTDLPPTFLNCLYKHVMPSLKILELPQMAWVPLPTILQNTPPLRHIHPGTEHDSIFQPDLLESGELFQQGDVVSLSVDRFHELDFGIGAPLVKFIECNGRNIRTLHLGSYYDTYSYVHSFDFLSSCPIMTGNLVHLSFGEDLFHVAENVDVVFSLTMFPRLETFSCPILFPHRSSQWFRWLSDCLLSAIVSTSSPLPLKKIYSLVSYSPALQEESDINDVQNNLDEVAEYLDLDCSLEFSVPISEGNETLQSIFRSLREQLPTWDQDGRLKLWIEM